MIDLPPPDAPQSLRLSKLVEFVDPPNRSACITAFNALRLDERFLAAPGSAHNHQAWPGGYYDHIAEAMHIAVNLYSALSRIRRLPFSLSDAVLGAFLHDFEKPWKHVERMTFPTKAERHAFRMEKIAKFGFVLTPELENAIKYAEGEHDDYSPKKRVMGPLAAFIHSCDVLSARLWWDEPKQENR